MTFDEIHVLSTLTMVSGIGLLMISIYLGNSNEKNDFAARPKAEPGAPGMEQVDADAACADGG